MVDVREEREPERLQSVLPPVGVAGSQYDAMVVEIKRLTTEYDAIEEPGAFTQERYETLKADVKRLGEAIHALGGIDLMLLMVKVHVPPTGGLQGCFDRGFNGIGEWRC